MNKSLILTKKGTATRQALLDAAKQTFANKGFLNTDIGEVAILAGKSRATLYNYMAGKTELLLALIDDFRADDIGLPDVDGAILLRDRRAILRTMWDIYDRHATTLDALDQAATVDPAFAQQQRDIQRRGVENCQLIFRYQQDNGRCLQFDPDVAGLMLATMINATIQKMISQRKVDGRSKNDEEMAFENLVKMVEAIIFCDDPVDRSSHSTP